MARLTYDDRTAAAFQEVREPPRDAIAHWRTALDRHAGLAPGMLLADVGAGTGAFAAAFTDWFGVDVVAVEPSAAMRARIRRDSVAGVLAGHAGALPLATGSVDAVWLSLVIHHVPDLSAAAREVRRVLRPGGPVLIRQGFPGRVGPDRTFPWEFFPEVHTMVEDTYPSLDHVCRAFAVAGLHRTALEPVAETPTALAALLARLDDFRHADTNLRRLSDEQFRRGRELLRRAVPTSEAATRASWLDLLVLR